MIQETSNAVIEERLEKGVAYKIEGQYEEAVRELRGLLAETPDHARAHHELGLVLGFTGDFDGSLAALARAVELDADGIKARTDLALTYCMLGRYEEAKVGFETVLAADPENETAQKNLDFLRDF